MCCSHSGRWDPQTCKTSKCCWQKFHFASVSTLLQANQRVLIGARQELHSETGIKVTGRYILRIYLIYVVHPTWKFIGDSYICFDSQESQNSAGVLPYSIVMNQKRTLNGFELGHLVQFWSISRGTMSIFLFAGGFSTIFSAARRIVAGWFGCQRSLEWPITPRDWKGCLRMLLYLEDPRSSNPKICPSETLKLEDVPHFLKRSPIVLVKRWWHVELSLKASKLFLILILGLTWNQSKCCFLV